jgi:hypothetical protein
MKKEYDFKLVWQNPPRSMTKAEWKVSQRWLRLVRRQITKKIDMSKINKVVWDAMLYGTGCLRYE